MIPLAIGGGALIGGGISVAVQLAATGSIDPAQVGIAAAAGAAGAGAALVAATAAIAATAVTALTLASGAIGGASELAANAAAGEQSTVGGVASAIAVNAAAGALAGGITNAAKYADEALGGIERIANGNLVEGARKATESAGGKLDIGATRSAVVNGAAEAANNIPNMNAPPPPPPPEKRP